MSQPERLGSPRDFRRSMGISQKRLNVLILLGALVGVLAGIILQRQKPSSEVSASVLVGVGLVADVFIGMLKMLLVPLIFTSISLGISQLRAHKHVNRVWLLTFAYFLCTTMLAILLGLVLVNVFEPGKGMGDLLYQGDFNVQQMQSLSPGEFLQNFLKSLFMNPVAAMARGEVVPIVVSAIALGVGLVLLGDKAATLEQLVKELFAILMKVISGVMLVAPLGICALLTQLLATADLDLLIKLGGFAALVFVATMVHGVVTLPLVLRIFSGMSPFKFFIGMKEVLVTAFSTSSSTATLPFTLKAAKENLGVDPKIAHFVLPVGATVNMDGSALYEAIAAVFVANLVGVDLHIGQQLTVFFIAIVASLGAPGIPSAGMVTMIMVLQSVGLPAEAVGLLLPMDRLLDTFRTAVNVEGDAVGACIVNRLVKAD